MATAAALVLLAALAAPGVALLRRAGLAPLEQFAYGPVLGVVLGSLALLGVGSLLGGLSVGLISGLALVSVLAALVLSPSLRHPETWRRGLATGIARVRARTHERGARIAVAVLGLLALRWVVLWSGMLTLDDAGLWVAQRNVWADWGLHLGDVASFAHGDNLPPGHPRFAGHAFSYHHLSALTAAAMVELGLELRTALPLHSALFSLLLTLGLYAFGRRLGLARGAASLATVLFLVGGGLGWWIVLRTALAAPAPLAALWQQAWDPVAQEAANLRWPNVAFALIAPQRAYLYGLPLGLLVLTLLLRAVRGRRSADFLAAGLVAGLLPFAHLGSLLALALVTPFLLLLFPQRGWLGFFGAWVALGLPQLLAQQGGQPGALALRWQPGWIAPPDPWLGFWLENAGLLLPLALVALASRRLFGGTERRFLLGFVPVFLVANLVVFQPWDWDNTKVLVWVFLAACLLVAGWIARQWQTRPSPAVRTILAVAVATLLLSGLLENLQQLRGGDRHLLLTADELRLAERVRAETPKDALFLVGLQHNHPVPVLGGRRVLMGYPGWLWSQGIDYAERERDLRAIFALGPGAEEWIARYGIDFVVVGPRERQELGADAAAFRRRYPVALRTEAYEVFDVSSAKR